VTVTPSAASTFPQHQVHHPAAADVDARFAAVGEDRVAIAPGFFEGVGEDRQGGEVAVLIHLRGDADRVFGAPTRIEPHRPERAAEDVAEERRYVLPHCRILSGSKGKQGRIETVVEVVLHHYGVDGRVNRALVHLSRRTSVEDLDAVGSDAGLDPLIFTRVSIGVPFGNFDSGAAEWVRQQRPEASAK